MNNLVIRDSVVATLPKIDADKLAFDVQHYASVGEDALGQASRAIVLTEEDFALAGALVKSVNAQIKEVDTKRKVYTSPFDSAKASIMLFFDTGLNKLKESKDILTSKQNLWLREEQKKREEIARATAKRAEEEALARAEAQAALGDDKGAEKVLTDATKTIEKIETSTKVSVTSAYGSQTSGVRVITGSVINIYDFVKAVGVSGLPANSGLCLSDVVEFKQSGLNKLAKFAADSKLEIPGLGINDRVEARSR